MEQTLSDGLIGWLDSSGLNPSDLRMTPVGGGSINDTYLIELSGERFFLKRARSHHPEMFAKEVRGLEAMRAGEGSYRIPEVYYQNEEELLLEFIETRVTVAEDDEAAGRALAEMHRMRQAQFGWFEDNYIGSLPQSNTPSETWERFFLEQRIAPLLRGANVLPEDQVENVLSEVAIYIRYKVPSEHPVLLHGDLWSGNRMTAIDGTPVWVDPAVYAGHREMDIAMTKLFGGFGQRFYDAYHESLSLEDNWKERIALCNLYPLLVHVHLFGLSYAGQVRTNLLELGLRK